MDKDEIMRLCDIVLEEKFPDSEKELSEYAPATQISICAEAIRRYVGKQASIADDIYDRVRDGDIELPYK